MSIKYLSISLFISGEHVSGKGGSRKTLYPKNTQREKVINATVPANAIFQCPVGAFISAKFKQYEARYTKKENVKK